MINFSLLVALLLSILGRIAATWQSTLSRSQLWSQQPVCSSVHCWRSPLLRGWVRRRTRTQQSTEEWIEIDVWSANVLPGLRAHWVVHVCSWRTFRQSCLIVLNILRHNELQLKVKRGPMQCAIVGSSLKFLRYHLIILFTATQALFAINYPTQDQGRKQKANKIWLEITLLGPLQTPPPHTTSFQYYQEF